MLAVERGRGPLCLACGCGGSLAAALAERAAGLKMYLNDTFSNLKLLDLATWGEHLKRWPAHVPIAVHAEGKTLAGLGISRRKTRTGRDM